MTATRVIDDHIELTNIGTKTHAEIESHIQGIGNYAFPVVDGTADQILKSNGAGVLSWTDQPAGFACGSLNACNLSDIGARPHSQLTNIGTSDHHVRYLDSEAVAAMGAKGDSNPLHHDKFTDQNAVDACDNSNIFLERNVTNAVTATTTLWKNTTGSVLTLGIETSGFTLGGSPLALKGEHLTRTYLNTLASLYFPDVIITGTDQSVLIGRFQFFKAGGTLNSIIKIYVANNLGGSARPLDIHYNKFDVRVNLYLTSIKSGTTQAGAGASANEVWKTNSHASLPDNVLLIGV